MIDWLTSSWLWLTENWLYIVVPLVIFLATYVVGLWVRRIVYRVFNRWAAAGKWEGSQLIIQATRTPFIYWFLILGAFIAIQVSKLDTPGKILADKILVSFFVFSLSWVVVSLSTKILKRYHNCRCCNRCLDVARCLGSTDYPNHFAFGRCYSYSGFSF